MHTPNFDPWKNFHAFDPAAFEDKSSELQQWPIKLWQAPVLSPYYHQAHLLIAADCSAYACPDFHNIYSKGKLTLICCPETDFDIMTKLSKILKYNDISSITIVRTDRECCEDLSDMVSEALKSSKLPIPVQLAVIPITAEDVSNED